MLFSFILAIGLLKIINPFNKNNSKVNGSFKVAFIKSITSCSNSSNVYSMFNIVLTAQNIIIVVIKAIITVLS